MGCTTSKRTYEEKEISATLMWEVILIMRKNRTVSDNNLMFEKWKKTLTNKKIGNN